MIEELVNWLMASDRHTEILGKYNQLRPTQVS
jgi:uncharacterized protein (DUF433 family)